MSSPRVTLLLTFLTSFSSHSVSFLSHIDFIPESLCLIPKPSGLIPNPLCPHSKSTQASFQIHSGFIPNPLCPHSKSTLVSFQIYFGLIPNLLWPHSKATLSSFHDCFMNFLQSIEIPFLKVVKKVKSMQMFHQPVQKASQVY